MSFQHSFNVHSVSPFRMNWIDWMKSIGIYLIVLGHFFSIGNQYIYTFSVPLFFIISGFLCKQETDNKLFWKKIWYNLVIPMLLISVINFVIETAFSFRYCTFDVNSLYKFPINILLGSLAGVGGLWFVYTLVLLKILLQFVSRNKVLQISLFILFLALSILIEYKKPLLLGHEIVNSSNSIVNVCLAYPFFISGFFIKNWKNFLTNYHNMKVEVGTFILCILIIIICGKLNGVVKMYINGYGGNIFLFLIGGYAGSLMIFIISKWLDS